MRAPSASLSSPTTGVRRRPWTISAAALDRVVDRHRAVSFARRWRDVGFVVIPASIRRPLRYLASDPERRVVKERVGISRFWAGMAGDRNMRAFISDVRSARDAVTAVMVIAPPHIVAIDVDEYDRSPQDLLAAFTAWAGAQPAAAHVTPNRGVRLLYPVSAGREVATRIGRKACPFKAEVLTGPFIAAPSYGPGGVECPWLVGNVTTLPPAPSNENAIPTVMRPKRFFRRGASVASPHLKPGHVGSIPEEDKRLACGSGVIPVGRRNNAAWFAAMIAAQALGAAATFSEVRALIQDKIEPRLEKPLPPGELKAIVKSVVAYTAGGRNFVRAWSGRSRYSRFLDFVDARAAASGGKPFTLADVREHGFRHEDVVRAVEDGRIAKHGEREKAWSAQEYVRAGIDVGAGPLSPDEERGEDVDGAAAPTSPRVDRIATTVVGEADAAGGSTPVCGTAAAPSVSRPVPPAGQRENDPSGASRGPPRSSGPPVPASPTELHHQVARAEAGEREDFDDDDLVLVAAA